jgi:hypothetical protein
MADSMGMAALRQVGLYLLAAGDLIRLLTRQSTYQTAQLLRQKTFGNW